MKKSTEALLESSKETGLEDQPKHMFTFHHENTEQNNNLMIANNP
jgi:hypothetical protein